MGATDMGDLVEAPWGRGVMKVLHITPTSRQGGGPEHILQHLRAAPPHVHCHVAAPREAPYWDRFHAACQGKVLEVPHRALRLSAIRGLTRYVVEHGIDIIHTHGKAAGLYGRILVLTTRARWIHTPHGLHVKHYLPWLKRAYVLFENLTSFGLDHVVHVSESEQQVAQSLNLWPRVPSTIIENGVQSRDASLDIRREMRRALGLMDDDFVVVTASRFDTAKNMREWAEVAVQCPNIKFLVLGDGEDRAAFESEWTRPVRAHVVCTGFVSDPWRYFVASDLYLSTSLWEGLPLAVLEAMSVGMPVVASNVEGNRNCVVEGETGHLYSQGIPSQASSIILALQAASDTRKRMAEAGQAHQRKWFSVENMSRRTVQLYERIYQANKQP